MSIKDFDQQVEGLWAAYFGCSPEDFGHEGTTLLPLERLRGQNLIHTVYIRKRALAEIDPALQAEVEEALRQVGSAAVLSSELLQRAWGPARKADIQAGLVFHLRAGELVRPELDPQFVLRRLTQTDQPAMTALRECCAENEIDEAFVEIGHEIAWGCFQGEQLVAVGSGYRRNGFMDYGVLTNPDFRGHGLARHVVCALTDDSHKLGLIPQYRCNRVNKASRRVAEAAGFTLYYTTEGVRLAG